jgi:hypothetical protein
VYLHIFKGKIDGIMAGRWILRRPLDLFDIDDHLNIRGTFLFIFK